MRRSGCRISLSHGFDFIRAARLFDGRPGLDAQSCSTLSLARRSVWLDAQSGSTLSLARRSVWLDAQSPRGREHRILSIGELDGVMIAVAWTQRGADVCWIISVRRARDEEKRQ